MIKKRITFFIWRLSGRSKFIRYVYIFIRFHKFNIFSLIHKASHSMGHFCRDRNEIEKKEYRIKLMWDMVLSQYKFGSDFNEYYLYNFEGLSDEEREKFITEYGRYYYYGILNKPQNQRLFYQKDITYSLFRKYFKRDLIRIDKKADNALFERFISNNDRFIYKPLAGWGGSGIYFVNSKDYISSKQLLAKLIESGNGVAEELIKQKEFMANIHQDSINTVRMTTILLNNLDRNISESDVYILAPILRVGTHGSFVDNAASGGICSNIDKLTGVIYSDGADEMGNIFSSHPNSGVNFKGLQIPKWNEAISLVEELAHIVPSNRFVGWDLALTDQGWVLVEANASAQFIVLQIGDKIGKKDELVAILQKI